MYIHTQTYTPNYLKVKLSTSKDPPKTNLHHKYYLNHIKSTDTPLLVIPEINYKNKFLKRNVHTVSNCIFGVFVGLAFMCLTTYLGLSTSYSICFFMMGTCIFMMCVNTNLIEGTIVYLRRAQSVEPEFLNWNSALPLAN